MEQRILSCARDLGQTGEGCALVSNPEEWHVAPHQTWWTLDVCGSALLGSPNPEIRRLAGHLLSGLSSLSQEWSRGSIGYPLTLYDPPDLGGTAAIAEVLLRLDPELFRRTRDRVVRFVTESLAGDGLDQCRHVHIIWAVPCFLEACVRRGHAN